MLQSRRPALEKRGQRHLTGRWQNIALSGQVRRNKLGSHTGKLNRHTLKLFTLSLFLNVPVVSCMHAHTPPHTRVHYESLCALGSVFLRVWPQATTFTPGLHAMTLCTGRTLAQPGWSPERQNQLFCEESFPRSFPHSS